MFVLHKIIMSKRFKFVKFTLGFTSRGQLCIHLRQSDSLFILNRGVAFEIYVRTPWNKPPYIVPRDMSIESYDFPSETSPWRFMI